MGAVYFDGTSFRASFTLCQKGSLTCPARGVSLTPARPCCVSQHTTSDRGVGEMFCIFSILVFQSPLVGVGSS